ARAAARRAKSGGAGQVRLAAAPPIRRSGVHLERRAAPRREREPRVRRGLPGVPRGRLTTTTPHQDLGLGQRCVRRAAMSSAPAAVSANRTTAGTSQSQSSPEWTTNAAYAPAAPGTTGTCLWRYAAASGTATTTVTRA